MKRNSVKQKISKAELGFYIALLSITVGMIIYCYPVSKKGNQVEVRIDGKVTARYSLDENRTVKLPVKEINIIKIQDGSVWMEEADCPDKVCIKKGKIHRINDSIICLPHKVVVEIKQNDQETTREDEIDVIAK